MTESITKPYTIIEEVTNSRGRRIDRRYLVRGGIRRRLTATEHALTQSLLSPKGLDLEEVGQERESGRGNRLAEVIGTDSAKVVLHKLRNKIKDAFGDSLVIPLVIGRGKGEFLKGLRLWTKEELAEFHQRLQNPGEGIVTIIDERTLWHLFVDGHEIHIDGQGKNGISALYCLIVQSANSAAGLQLTSRRFKEAYQESTGRQEITPEELIIRLSNLRKALEAVGWTLTRRKPGVKYESVPSSIRLLPIPAIFPIREPSKLAA